MRSALVLSIASLAVAQQQGVGPASTIQLQPGQFSVFGQPRQQPVNIPGTQGQVVAQFIDETGQSIPIQQLGQPQQQQRFQPQQQQFQPQQQQFQPQPQQQRFQPAPQQQFRPAPQQQFRPAPVQPQQQQFRPAPQQQPAAGSFRATANQQDAHAGHLQVHQQNLAIQQQQFSPEQRQALREFQANPPPPRAPQQAAPQPQRFQPAPQPQRQRPAPQPQRFQPAPQQQFSQFSQFPAQGAPQRRPEAPRAAAPAPRRQPEPGSVNDALGQQVVAAENYVHDPTGDATLSRFQLFQLRKKQEAQQGAAAPQA